MSSLPDRIRRVAPQYQPDSDDLRWFETELERIQDRALPKLVRKRFVDTLRTLNKASSGAKTGGNAPRAVAPVPASTPQK